VYISQQQPLEAIITAQCTY